MTRDDDIASGTPHPREAIDVSSVAQALLWPRGDTAQVTKRAEEG